jgi:SAM-dependent methyltransferase
MADSNSDRTTAAVLHHYFDEHEASASPDAVVPWLIAQLGPTSVVDVGCGLGQWLEAFVRHMPGVEVLGLDGHHVPRERMRISSTHFLPVDLSAPASIRLPRAKKFDLALSLEVAEHLTEDKADDFVGFLASLSDAVLFSAAIPGQTGENHHNEQWPDYWVAKFGRVGFIPFDEIRWKIWNLQGVSWWYKQNMLLFKRIPAGTTPAQDTTVRSVVHPDCFTFISDMYNGAERQLECLAGEIARLNEDRARPNALLRLLRTAIWRRLRTAGSNIVRSAKS